MQTSTNLLDCFHLEINNGLCFLLDGIRARTNGASLTTTTQVVAHSGTSQRHLQPNHLHLHRKLSYTKKTFSALSTNALRNSQLSQNRPQELLPRQSMRRKRGNLGIQLESSRSTTAASLNRSFKQFKDKYKGKLPTEEVKRLSKELCKVVSRSHFKKQLVRDPTRPLDGKLKHETVEHMKEYFSKAHKKLVQTWTNEEGRTQQYEASCKSVVCN